MSSRLVLTAVSLTASLMVSACANSGANTPPASAPKPRYVALGSSFAAGAGIAPSADVPTNRCGRSSNNYAHKLAAIRHLDLIDVSCGGAMTAHILGPWGELPPQLDAVTANTALVTITIGGNDVGYIASLFAASCAGEAALVVKDQIEAMCKAMRARGGGNDAPKRPDADAWSALANNLGRIGAAIRERAPNARIVFVDYVTILPKNSICDEVPLRPESATTASTLATKLAEVTRNAARAMGADIIQASQLSKAHDVCAEQPWATGFVGRDGMLKSAPYHPNEEGMNAIAAELVKLLAK